MEYCTCITTILEILAYLSIICNWYLYFKAWTCSRPRAWDIYWTATSILWLELDRFVQQNRECAFHMLMGADSVPETSYSISESRTMDYVQKLIQFSRAIRRVSWLKVADVQGSSLSPSSEFVLSSEAFTTSKVGNNFFGHHSCQSRKVVSKILLNRVHLRTGCWREYLCIRSGKYQEDIGTLEVLLILCLFTIYF
jgi:hypothetical protein